MSEGRINIHMQIAEVQREIAIRRRVYPDLVGRGRMRQGEADLALARMEAVLQTLAWVRDNRERIAALVTGATPTPDPSPQGGGEQTAPTPASGPEAQP